MAFLAPIGSGHWNSIMNEIRDLSKIKLWLDLSEQSKNFFKIIANKIDNHHESIWYILFPLIHSTIQQNKISNTKLTNSAATLLPMSIPNTMSILCFRGWLSPSIIAVIPGPRAAPKFNTNHTCMCHQLSCRRWHVNNIPTMQFFTGIFKITQSKSYVLSLNGCVWKFQNNALWDTY